jgi:hypothetical protein
MRCLNGSLSSPPSPSGTGWRPLPPDDEATPSVRERLAFLLFVVIPWIGLYELTVHLHLPGTPFQFEFENSLPIYPWTALIYQSIYLVVAAAPWLARTRADLRRLTISVWVSLVVVFPVYWLAPSQAPRRALDATSWVARVLAWERSTYPPTAAFPSYHALWVLFIARLIRPAWLGAAYAAAVIVSCVTTGMHFIPDLLASLLIAPFLCDPERIWRAVHRRIAALAGGRLVPECEWNPAQERRASK